MVLHIKSQDFCVKQKGRCIEQPGSGLQGNACDHSHVRRRLFGQPHQLCHGFFEQDVFIEQIRTGIACDSEFRKHRQLGIRIQGLQDPKHFVHVCLRIANGNRRGADRRFVIVKSFH